MLSILITLGVVVLVTEWLFRSWPLAFAVAGAYFALRMTVGWLRLRRLRRQELLLQFIRENGRPDS